MSWVATAGGVVLGPAVGALASRLVTDQVKPKELTTQLFIGSAVHAAAAMLAYSLSESVREENLKAFAYGTTWGSGISAALLASSGLYLKTDAGKKMFAAHPDWHSTAGAERLSGGIAPGGLLGLLTAAKKHGYT
jgi:hypothetical protein